MPKRYPDIRKLLVGIAIFLTLAIAVLWFSSPFRRQQGFSVPVIQHTIEINAPADRVYRYLGNSQNAALWSVYVDHIAVLNDSLFADGTIGSRRRCFTKADETGKWWDEEIVENLPGTKRRLTIYNLNGFPLTANHLVTEQLYTPLENGHSRLTFAVFFSHPKPTPAELLKTKLAAFEIKRIFKGNLLRIKTLLEKN